MRSSPAAFDRFAPTWDAEHGRHSPRAAEFRARLALLERLCAGRRRVLELGCGTGQHLVALAPAIGEGVGVDFSPAMIDRARANAEAAGIANLRFLTGDAVTADTGTEPFDAVLLLGVIEHLPDRAAALASCRDRLAGGGPAGGGRVVIVAPHPANPAFLWHRLRHGAPARLFEGDRHLSPRGLARLARSCGLEPEGLHALPGLPSHEGEGAPPAAVRALMRAASRLPLPAARGAFALVLKRRS
ncbi:class I SAM-dependent methyltransferase [Arenibaculum sp.]|jgi:SAM-dependent methyltransferase|uniref:class I SAM-dependent methyltransferase n=1 Tax=Arenibaculum sp. TaxID=2865862 RepID=UPI002E136EE2|nr:class I SAM-dependent methyltransferase [Arenibaculum sp.]